MREHNERPSGPSDTPEIVITPEMIEAGTLEVMQFNSREDSVENAEEIARAVFLAMYEASHSRA